MTIRALYVSVLLVLIAIASAALQAKQSVRPPITPVSTEYLLALMPQEVGEWQRIDSKNIILPLDFEPSANEAIAYGAYVDDLGRVITMLIAYGPPQGNAMRLHRPEICYRAQGFRIDGLDVSRVDTSFGPIPVIQMSANKALRQETVSYWMREGDYFQDGPSYRIASALRRFRFGPHDGVLIRLSSRGIDPLVEEMHHDFAASFVQVVPQEAHALFWGGAL